MPSKKMIPIDDARIIFRNFRGEERKFNPKGSRNFNLVLTPEQFALFSSEGYNVRVRPPRDADSDEQYLLPVKVNYNNRPPKVYMVSGSTGKKTELDEETIGELDYAELERVDLKVTPYNWTMPNGSSGVTAYLHTMYAVLVEDEFEDRYSN